jgi:MFS family permease
VTLYLLILINVLNQIAYSGSRVAVSLYALEIGASPFMVGMVISLYALCPVLLSIVIGKFADRVPPRLPMIIGTAGVGLTLLLLGLFPGYVMLYVLALCAGFFHQMYLIPMEAGVGGLAGSDKRAANYAFVAMGHSIGNFLGPVVAGLSIDRIGHVPAFMVLASIAVGPLLLLIFRPNLMPRSGRHSVTEARGSILDLLRIRDLRNILIAGAVITSAWDLFQFYLPIYGHSIGLSASAIGTIIGMVSVATFTIRGVVPYLIRRFTEAEILSSSVFVTASAFTLLPFLSSPYALAAVAFLLGLGIGCAQPMSMSLMYVLTPRGRIAESTGLRKTTGNTMHLMVPIIFGSVGTAFGFTGVFLSNFVVLTASGLLIRKSIATQGGSKTR